MTHGRASNRDKLIKREYCEVCGFNQFKSALCTHYKDGDSKNNTFNNLQVLCLNCHAIIHSVLKYVWKGGGRPEGSKDSKPRRRIGYFNRYKVKISKATKVGLKKQ